MSTEVIKTSECNHPYWDENRCIDCGASRMTNHTQSIWETFQPTEHQGEHQ